MQSCEYKEDVFHGVYRSHFADGGVEISGSYNMGLQDGTWLYYDEEGNVKDSLIYQMGQLQNPEVLDRRNEEFFKHIEENTGNMPDPADDGF